MSKRGESEFYIKLNVKIHKDDKNNIELLQEMREEKSMTGLLRGLIDDELIACGLERLKPVVWGGKRLTQGMSLAKVSEARKKPTKYRP